MGERSFFSSSSSSSTTNNSKRSVADMGSRDGELRVFMVAGEVSGDAIASRLMSSLRKISPFPLRFAGVGGYALFTLHCHLSFNSMKFCSHFMSGLDLFLEN